MEVIDGLSLLDLFEVFGIITAFMALLANDYFVFGISMLLVLFIEATKLKKLMRGRGE